MRKIWIKVAAISLLCMAGTGCSTFVTLVQGPMMYGKNSGNRCSLALPYVFSGTVHDVTFIMKPVLCENVDITEDWAGFALPYGLIDLPFSLVADTVILPYTIYRQSTYGNIKNSGD